MNRKAVIVFSGGQDSTTVLGKALYDGFECFAIGFDYGQKHAIEMEQAKKIADKLRVPFLVVNAMSFGALVGSKSALLNSGQEVGDKSLLADNLPASFVPNRNAMFLTLAHGYAQVIGAASVWTGVCETDYSGYPDCRAIFINALEAALNTGYQTGIDFIAPLMRLSKAQTFKMAEDCGVLDLVIEESHTCYNGVRATTHSVTTPNGLSYIDVRDIHEWGHGCGECPACKLRAKGWEDYKRLA